MIDQVVELGRRGATDAEIAVELGISVSTVNEWKSSNALFSESLKMGKRVADSRVQQALYSRAVGFTGPDGQYHPPHPVAAIFWMKNRQPAEWRDTTRSEITGADGAPVQLAAGPPRPSAEEIAEFSKQLYSGFIDHRDEKTGEGVDLGAEQAASLAEIVTDFATGQGKPETPPATLGGMLAMVVIVREKIRRECDRKGLKSL